MTLTEALAGSAEQTATIHIVHNLTTGQFASFLTRTGLERKRSHRDAATFKFIVGVEAPVDSPAVIAATARWLQG